MKRKMPNIRLEFSNKPSIDAHKWAFGWDHITLSDIVFGLFYEIFSSNKILSPY